MMGAGDHAVSGAEVAQVPVNQAGSSERAPSIGARPGSPRTTEGEGGGGWVRGSRPDRHRPRLALTKPMTTSKNMLQIASGISTYPAPVCFYHTSWNMSSVAAYVLGVSPGGVSSVLSELEQRNRSYNEGVFCCVRMFLLLL